MPNHIHIVAVPAREEELQQVFRPLHTRYAQRINRACKWKGHPWQGRFFPRHVERGLPCGAEGFLRKLERRVAQVLRWRAPGRPKNERKEQ